MKVLFINSVVGFGSTGKIVYELALLDNVDYFVAYGRKSNNTNLKNVYKTTSFLGNVKSFFETLLFDKHGFTNKRETKKLIEKIKGFSPDIVHLHNLHGYYLDVEVLFEFLKNINTPVVWTLHDCWSLTGYCPHFDYINCNKWIDMCENCPKPFMYPFSIFKQRTKINYLKKIELFNNFNNLTIVTPSKWLENTARQSILKNSKILTITNGIDLNRFYPTKNKSCCFSILFVSNIWTKTKGIDEMIKMIKLLDNDIKINIVGKYINPNPYLKNRCNLIDHTENLNDLVDLYSESNLFVNMTLEETFGLVNVEALACGTPVLTYDTGGSPEIINNKCGLVVDKHNYVKMAETINKLRQHMPFDGEDCVRQSRIFSKEKMLDSYMTLYKALIKDVDSFLNNSF